MIGRMPGTNLTRDEAATRAALLDVTSYAVDLDLTTGDTTFASVTTLEFTCREPGSSTFADLVAPTVREIILNGRSLDPATAYADSRVALDDLEATNTLVVTADCAYSHTGEGLHRFVVGKRQTEMPSDTSSGSGVAAFDTTTQCDGAVTVKVKTDLRSGCSKVVKTRRASGTSNCV